MKQDLEFLFYSIQNHTQRNDAISHKVIWEAGKPYFVCFWLLVSFSLLLFFNFICLVVRLFVCLFVCLLSGCLFVCLFGWLVS